MPNFYEVLGLTPSATPEQVKVAFHALAKDSHPDVNAGDVTAAQRFKDINEAYEILSDRRRRAVYDLGLRHERADTRWRYWNSMAVTTASLTIVLGCGLYFLLHHRERPFAQARVATDVASNSTRPTPQSKQDNLPERGERATATSSGGLSDVMGSGQAKEASKVEAERVLRSAPSSPPAAEPSVPRLPVTPTLTETEKPTVPITSSGSSAAPTPVPQVESEQTPPSAAEPPVEVGSAPPTAEQPEKTIVVSGASGPAPSSPDPQADREQALHLYAMGMERIARGDVIAARSLFLLAAKKGSVPSMRALAGTYDPAQLAKLKVVGMNANFDAAREWYEKVGDQDAIAAAEQAARDEAAEVRHNSEAAVGLAQFRAAYLSGEGLAYVVVNDEMGTQTYRYGDPSRSKAKKVAQAYTLYLCDTPYVFTPRRPEDLAALLSATVVNPGDFDFRELDVKYLSACPDSRSAIPRD